jgi:uncharacterized repeat protein (TIGR01451 family)
MSRKKLGRMFVLLTLLSLPLSAQFHIIHSFTVGSADGAHPVNTPLLSGSVLYGATCYGGSADKGILFKVNIDGSGFIALHTFTGSSTNGAYPQGTLVLISTTLYGTTSSGGTANSGTVFKIDTDGNNFLILHSFLGGSSDGSSPRSSVVVVGATLYGTTTYGGPDDKGTIFQVDTDGSDFGLLRTFAGGLADGAHPYGPLLLDGSTFYGMTYTGGASNMGTVFKIGTGGSGFGLVRSFAGGTTDGAYPSYGGLAISGSTLFGLTQNGGSDNHGTIFAVNTAGTGFNVLHSFVSGTTDGYEPKGSLVLSGSTLFGMTYFGGEGDKGTIFSVGTDGSNYSSLHSFAGGELDGAHPYCDLLVAGSLLYGMTYYGGSTDYGTLFVYSTAPAADASVAKTADNLNPAPLSTVIFTVTVGNAGPGDATGVVVTDHLPAQLTYLSSRPSPGSYNSSTGVWTVGSLAKDATATLTLAAKVNSSGTIINTAAKSGQIEADPNAANDSDSLTLTTVPQKLLLPPILLEPLNNATGQPTTVTLKWQDTNSTPPELKYKLRIKKAGGTYANYLLSVNTVQFVKSGLTPSKTYYWNVMAMGNGTTIKNSAWANGGVDFKFTVAPPVILNVPLLTWPYNTAIDQPLSVTLEWADTNTSPQELKYKVRFKVAGGAYTNTTLGLGVTTLTKSGLAKGKTYCWSVQAVGNGTSIKNSAWPADFKFTTIH